MKSKKLVLKVEIQLINVCSQMMVHIQALFYFSIKEACLFLVGGLRPFSKCYCFLFFISKGRLVYFSSVLLLNLPRFIVLNITRSNLSEY